MHVLRHVQIHHLAVPRSRAFSPFQRRFYDTLEIGFPYADVEFAKWSLTLSSSMFENSSTVTRLSTTDQSWHNKLIAKQPKQPWQALFDWTPFIGDYIRSHKKEMFWNLTDPGKEKLQPL